MLLLSGPFCIGISNSFGAQLSYAGETYIPVPAASSGVFSSVLKQRQREKKKKILGDCNYQR